MRAKYIFGCLSSSILFHLTVKFSFQNFEEKSCTTPRTNRMSSGVFATSVSFTNPSLEYDRASRLYIISGFALSTYQTYFIGQKKGKQSLIF